MTTALSIPLDYVADPAVSDLEKLLAAARQGDRTALEDFLQRIETRVYSFAWRLVGDPSSAEDVTQETLLKICRSLARYSLGTNLWAWIHRITVNQAHDYRRARPKTEDAGPEPSHSYDPAHDEKWRRVQEALQCLTEKERDALVLTEIEGYTSGEASDILGCLAITVRTRAAHARKKVRRYLTRYYPEIGEMT